MPVLPNSLSLVVIADGSPIVAADHRNNYAGIQGAANALIAILDNGNSIDGDPLVWDATLQKWSAASRLTAGRPRAPRVVTSPISGGPPASPLDGDIWIATGVDANGVRWQFQYNAGSASASKWEFIGGSPLQSYVSADETTASASLVEPTTQQRIPIPRAGDYDVSHQVETYNGSAAAGISIAVQGLTSGTNWTATNPTAPTANDARESADTRRVTLAAETIALKFAAPVGTAHVRTRRVTVAPVRIA